MFHHLSPFFFFWILRDLRVILQICHLQDFGKPFWHFSFCEILGIMFDNFLLGRGNTLLCYPFKVRRRNTVGTLLTEPLLRRPPQRLGFLHRVIFKALRRGRGQVLEGNLRWAGQCWSCHLNFKL